MTNEIQVNTRYIAKLNLLAKIHREIAPKLKMAHRLDSDTYCERHNIENSPELYGAKPNGVNFYSFSSGGGDCNPEMSQTSPVYHNSQVVAQRMERNAVAVD